MQLQFLLDNCNCTKGHKLAISTVTWWQASQQLDNNHMMT